MAETPFYINKHCHTGQLRERAHQIAEPILQIIKIGEERLGQIVVSEYPAVTASYIKNALDPLGFSPKLINNWREAEQDLPKLLGMVDALVVPDEIDKKLEEFLIPLDPFVDPNQARYYLTSFGKSLSRICSPEGRFQMGNVQSARRTLAAGRIFRHGFFKGIWFARPKGESIPDAELENLVSLDTRELPPPQRKPTFWWLDSAKPGSSRIYPEESAYDLQNPKFPLARLERFLRLKQNTGPEFPELGKQASKATFSAYGDCIDLGFRDQANELIEKYTPARGV